MIGRLLSLDKGPNEKYIYILDQYFTTLPCSNWQSYILCFMLILSCNCYPASWVEIFVCVHVQCVVCRVFMLYYCLPFQALPLLQSQTWVASHSNPVLFVGTDSEAGNVSSNRHMQTHTWMHARTGPPRAFFFLLILILLNYTQCSRCEAPVRCVCLCVISHMAPF